ncbi:MAG: BRCT domain-containing protein, partial [Microbacteriaceae bacterium]
KERLADDIDPEGPLAGLTLVITGVLPGMTRNEAYELIVMAGGEWGSAVTKTTDYLVDGDNAGETNKTRRVYELREKGVNVAILNAEGFFGLVSP